MSNKIAIIGGSALPHLDGFEVTKREVIQTAYGSPSSPVLHGRLDGHEVVFLNRHGFERKTPPHKINYRANISALHQLGVNIVMGVSIAGGIRSDMTPGHFAFPDQLIDYTYNRANTFFDDDFDFSKHIHFTHPYCPELHQLLVAGAEQLDLDFTDDATYGVTQGPRFETIAEINRLERDGCDIVGMTAMPEAVLARELGMRYACVTVIGSKAAGRCDGLQADMEAVKHVIANCMEQMRDLFKLVFAEL